MQLMLGERGANQAAGGGAKNARYLFGITQPLTATQECFMIEELHMAYVNHCFDYAGHVVKNIVESKFTHKP